MLELSDMVTMDSFASDKTMPTQEKQSKSHENQIYKLPPRGELADFYWAYADILRGIGVNESMYDQRIMAFMALKLLIDNQKLKFSFDYENQFGLSDNDYLKYKGHNHQQTFINIIRNAPALGINLKFFSQDKNLNPDSENNSVLYYLNHKRTFSLISYVEELAPHYFLMVLDIYNRKADFTDYPKEKYKDLYEVTIARMKKLAGDLTGQHFTQKSIIHLMCASVLSDLKTSKSEILAIYDPTCGTGSMLMESASYFAEHINKPIEVYGQEYHGQTWLLCKIFLEISGIKNTIAYGNTLTNPAFEKINGNNSFDFIIANTPFGVDWKHDYHAVISNMEKKKSNFLVIKDENQKIITPKKSDGQLLFMLHIMKLLQTSKSKGKLAKAAIISSSTLASTGKTGGSESRIRRGIFNLKYLYALIEQPNAMFTNTDISSHIWFFDNQHNNKSAQIIKAQNEENPLFIPHPNGRDKMKNSYSDYNIEQIIALFKNEQLFVSRNIEIEGADSINISQLVGKKDTLNSLSLTKLFNEIEQGLNDLCNLRGAFE